MPAHCPVIVYPAPARTRPRSRVKRVPVTWKPPTTSPHRVPRTRCGGAWTEARFRSFVMSALRAATVRWAPIAEVRRRARVERGKYLCAACESVVPSSVVLDGERKKNVFVDHVDPVIDPRLGFMSWDDVVERMFCEDDNLALLCRRCHDEKTAREKEIAVARRRRESGRGSGVQKAQA